MTLKTYNIVTLGASGSGKTVFLASMYHRLSTRRDGDTFFLSAPPDQQIELVARYNTIADTTEWPTGAPGLTEWEFTCSVRTREPYDVLRFTYLDYPGGWLTDPGRITAEFIRKLERANALLGFLDGQKLLALMAETPSDDEKKLISSLLDTDLANILPIMERSKCPIHFVITKWDLIKQAGFELAHIRKRLLEEEQFKAFVKNFIPYYTIRLIPVGSVGINGFVRVQSNGIPQKDFNKKPEPWQVELPLVCVLPDSFQAAMDAVYQHEEEISKSPTGPHLRRALWRLLRRSTGFLVFPAELAFRWGHIALFKREPDFGRVIIIILLHNLRGWVQTREEHLDKQVERLKKARDDSLKQVADERTALKHTVDAFLYLSKKLELDHPGSTLNDLQQDSAQ